MSLPPTRLPLYTDNNWFGGTAPPTAQTELYTDVSQHSSLIEIAMKSTSNLFRNLLRIQKAGRAPASSSAPAVDLSGG